MSREKISIILARGPEPIALASKLKIKSFSPTIGNDEAHQTLGSHLLLHRFTVWMPIDHGGAIALKIDRSPELSVVNIPPCRLHKHLSTCIKYSEAQISHAAHPVGVRTGVQRKHINLAGAYTLKVTRRTAACYGSQSQSSGSLGDT